MRIPAKSLIRPPDFLAIAKSFEPRARPASRMAQTRLNHVNAGFAPPLDSGTYHELRFRYVPFREGEAEMFRAAVEEAAALASISLFVGMIVVWAEVLSSL